MDSKHLSQDDFLHRLGELFNSRRDSDHGSIYLTQKRLTFGQDCQPSAGEKPFSDLQAEKPLSVIIRATNGKSKDRKDDKIKLSTIVLADELPGFYNRYAEVCKAGMTALKPRDRSKKKARSRRKKTAT